MTAPVGWIANRFGRKRIFILCSGGFTVASVMCGVAQDINQMVLFRPVAGRVRRGAGTAVAGGHVYFYALHERAKAMSIWGMGVMMGPIMGPSLGAWLTETYSWHGCSSSIYRSVSSPCFVCWFSWTRPRKIEAAVRLVRVPSHSRSASARCRSPSTAANSSAGSNPTRSSASSSSPAIGFYYFFAHSFTTSKPFIQFAIFKDKNFVGGRVFMAVMGLVLYSTMALSSPYLQNVIGYPIMTAGVLLGEPRLRHVRRDDAGRPADAVYRSAHADHRRPQHHRLFAVRT